MLFIERFIVLVMFGSFLVTLGLIFYNLSQRKKAITLVEAALKDNTVKALEDLLIAHDKDLDKDTKLKVRARIGDLLIEEDERELSQHFDSLSKK